MATRRIDTTIALDGEQAFKQGLASAAREMRVLESESRALAAGFGSSGDAAAQAAAKQKNLQNQVAQQEQIVSALEKAVKDAAAAYGDSSAEVDGYAVKLNNARTRLANLQKALSNADREVEELGRDSQKAGTQISQGIGEGAQEAEKDVRSLMETMQDSLSSIQSNTAVTAVKTVWDMASGAYNAVSGFVDGTVDYRRQLSFLQVNADNNGFDFTDIKNKLTEVTSLTGDASASIEGLSNLMAVPGMDQDTLARAIEGLSGAVISFPDTIKFESLADSLQETLASGEATGQFAEMLSRMGVSTEGFNKALAESKTQAGDLEIALAYLAAGGMNDVHKKWEQTNEAMVEAAQTKTELEDELATFAGTMEEHIVTPVRSVATNAMKYINAVVTYAEGKGEEIANNPIEKAAKETVDAAKGIAQNPFKEIFGDIFEGGWQMVSDAWAMTFGGMEWLPESGAKEAVTKKTGNIIKEGKEAGAEYAEGFAEGFDVTLDLTNVESKEALPLKQIGEKSMANVLESIDLEAYYKEMEDAGEKGGEQLTEGFDAGVAGGDASAANAGDAFGAAYAKGILSQVSYVSSAAASLAAAAAARVQGGISGVAGMVGGVLNIDGRAAGTFLAPYVSEAMTVSVE